MLLVLETAYSYEWSLISHPADYGGEMEHRYTQTLKLSHVSELQVQARAVCTGI